MDQHKKFLLDKLSDVQKKAAIKAQIAWMRRAKTIYQTLSTKNVKRKKLLSCHRDFVKIKVTPHGLCCLCWENSKNTTLFNSKFKWEGGYEITACKCNNLISLVPHCVNYTVENGEKTYYDFTRDYNNETHKYFIPDKDITYKALLGLDVNAKENCIEYGGKRCTCGSAGNEICHIDGLNNFDKV